MASLIRSTFKSNESLSEGEPWFQGDHMVFAMQSIPALAITSEAFMEIETRFAHTPKDHPGLVDCGQLVEVATELCELFQNLEGNLVSR
jgi:aminopeptidase YwaD